MIALVNPSSTDKKSRIQYLESTVWSPCTFRQLSLIHHLFLGFFFFFFNFFVYLLKVQSRLQSPSLLRVTTDEKS